MKPCFLRLLFLFCDWTASARAGSGKSDLAMRHAEEMMNAGVTVLIFDATRDWLKRSSIPNYITVRPNEAYRFKLNRHSFIFDMSLLSPIQQKELVKKVCKAVWDHQVQYGSHWYYLVFEEAHLFFPEGCMRSKEYQSLVQLVTGGRNYKIRFEIVTQFSAMIDKNVMPYMRQRYFGFSDEPNDVDYVCAMLRREYKDKLKSLKAGQFLYKLGNEVKLIEIEPFHRQMNPSRVQIPKASTKPKSILATNVDSKPRCQASKASTLEQIATITQIGSLLVFILLVLSVAFGV